MHIQAVNETGDALLQSMLDTQRQQRERATEKKNAREADEQEREKLRVEKAEGEELMVRCGSLHV